MRQEHSQNLANPQSNLLNLTRKPWDVECSSMLNPPVEAEYPRALRLARSSKEISLLCDRNRPRTTIL